MKRQGDHYFKASRSYTGRPHLRKEKKHHYIIVKLQVLVHRIFPGPIEKIALL